MQTAYRKLKGGVSTSLNVLTWIFDSLIPEIFRVDLLVVLENREVQMRSRAHASAANSADS